MLFFGKEGEKMNTYKFIIKGKVQGVYYRKTILDVAKRLNYKGEVKNLKNGDVQVIVNLDASNFESFVAILKKGSSFSKVSNLISTKLNTQKFTTFSITH